MHILQPKHSKLNQKEIDEILMRLNVSKAQLPKILLTDPALPEGCEVGDVIKIQRRESKDSVSDKNKSKEDKINIYYRAVV